MLDTMPNSCSCSPGSFEILLALAGAFLLGCLLCSLFRRLRELNHTHEEHNGGHASSAHPVVNTAHATETVPKETAKKVLPASSQSSQTYTGNRAVVPIQSGSDSSVSSYSTPKIDDLQRISSVDDKMINLLREYGIRSFTDLRDVKTELLYRLLDHPDFHVRRQEVETWPHQARLAAKGEWKKLNDYQQFMARSRQAIDSNRKSQRTNGADDLLADHNVHDSDRADDLTRLRGISAKQQKKLHKISIFRYRDLIQADPETLQAILGNSFDVSALKHEADLASKDQWDELEEFQDFQIIRKVSPVQTEPGVDSNLTAQPLDETAAEADSPAYDSEPGAAIEQDVEQTIASILEIDLDEDDSETSQADDLTRIEGINEKIAAILHENGIDSFEKLSQTHRNTLKSFLENAGNAFRLYEPETWPHQAGMAYRGEWQRLSEYQDFMRGKRAIGSALEPLSILEKSTANKQRNENPYVDDLTKIEGIGPKIEQLLNDAGILNYAQLKQTDRDTLKKVLERGGPQFKMHEPQSWPEQAELADSGQWQALESLQDKLSGGAT